MLWQLRKLSTNEELLKPRPLARNWGPIFGLEGVKDRLGDLSWLGSAYSDMGWFEVEGDITDLAEYNDITEEVTSKINAELAASADKVLATNDLTNAERQLWKEYRIKLQRQFNSPKFPNVDWPIKPE